MLKATISKQKQDKERLLAKAYVTRTKERDAQKLMSSDLAKVILGPRRAGKSVFSLMLLNVKYPFFRHFVPPLLPG